MSTTTTHQHHAPASKPTPTRLPYLSGLLTVFGLEMRQRLRSRGWYIMLAIWFVVILGVVLAVGLGTSAGAEVVDGAAAGQSAASAASDPGLLGADASTGQVQFELAVVFVLVFGALVAPAFAANAVSGDRAGGTLAIVQATLVTPGQILWGKWLAAWVAALAFLVAALPSLAVASFNGALSWGHCALMVLVVALEFGILCGIGVGLSAATARPLFSILSTYLVVALLGLGTLLAAGVCALTLKETVTESSQQPTAAAMKAQQDYEAQLSGNPTKDAELPFPEAANEMECGAETYTYESASTQRFTWVLAVNPVILLADAAAPPVEQHVTTQYGYSSVNTPATGPLGSLRVQVRQWQVGPQGQVACLAGELQDAPRLADQAPVWPIGLAVQLVLTAAIVALGRRRLVTPAARLARGTRVA